MSKLINGILDRLFVVLGVLLLSQAPQFFNQYEHHLEGHLAELQLQISQIEIAASHTGKSLDQYIAKFHNSKDQDFIMQGKVLNQMTNREKKLSDSVSTLQHASIVSRPFYFLFHINWVIAKETITTFQPGFVFNLEGIVYSLAGIFLGLGAYWLLREFFLMAYRVLKIPKES